MVGAFAAVMASDSTVKLTRASTLYISIKQGLFLGKFYMKDRI